MELILNLAWVCSVVVFFSVWLRHPRHTGADRRLQFIALAVLVLILFPVISVTDDLQTSQNPAEADCCLRRDHVLSNAHSIFPAVATLPPAVMADLSFGFPQIAAPGSVPSPVVDHPGLARIQNRPPPLA
jgi:hypothetical protein